MSAEESHEATNSPSPAGKPKRRARSARLRRLLKLVVLFVTLLGCFLALEIGLRLFGKDLRFQGDGLMVVASKDPQRIFELRPSYQVDLEGQPIRTNSAGFRDVEFVPEKPQGTFRIAIVGDSVTFGWGVAVEEAYPNQLERLLAPEGTFEVMNMGVGGYNSLQQVAVVRSHALNYDPDLLVVGYVLNDNKEDGADGGVSLYFKRGPSRAVDWLKIHARRVMRAIGRDVRTEAFEDLANLAAKAKVPVVVVIFPEYEFMADGSYEHSAEHVAVRALAERQGFKVLDLEGAFREQSFDLALMRDNVHPSPAGHVLCAMKIHAFLREQGYLPPVTRK